MPGMRPSSTLRRFAWVLGIGGLIPFVALAWATLYMDSLMGRLAVASLIQYAAIILTFVGAVHWGVALGHRDMESGRIGFAMVWSVLPALFAWVVVQFTPGRALPLLAFGLAGALVVDLIAYRRAPVPGWFMQLRALLTGVAVLSLVAAMYSGPGRQY